VIPPYFAIGLPAAGTAVLYLLTALLCLAGIALSALAVSGTWLVVAAAALQAAFRPGFPGWKTVAAFVAVAAAVEVLDAAAGFWGVRRKGGSRLAGWGAVVGGLVGGGLGTAVVPLVGTAVGMLLGAFAGAGAVELLRKRGPAAATRVAWGAALSRMLVTALKVAAALGMTAVLLVGMLLGRGG